MRISDWSSDVCSSDLPVPASGGNRIGLLAHPRGDELRQRGSTMVRDTEQADFADYAAARWTTLVRAAMLLGCPLHDAEDLVQTKIGRQSCRARVCQDV